MEVARLVEGYTANFQSFVEHVGYISDSFLRAAPGSPIEAVAMWLTTETIWDAIENPWDISILDKS